MKSLSRLMGAAHCTVKTDSACRKCVIQTDPRVTAYCRISAPDPPDGEQKASTGRLTAQNQMLLSKPDRPVIECPRGYHEAARTGAELVSGLDGEKFCTKCGWVGRPPTEKVKERDGVYWVLVIILLCCFLVPGILYAAFGGRAQPYYVCPSCRSRLTMIPATSPVALAAISAFTEGGQNSQPSPAERLLERDHVPDRSQ
jgi:hypothetical protein